ncbi:hypothetical protein K9692_004711 [Escherichia coli]|nr:hypothetical protein [Escherichia coli]
MPDPSLGWLAAAVDSGELPDAVSHDADWLLAGIYGASSWLVSDLVCAFTGMHIQSTRCGAQQRVKAYDSFRGHSLVSLAHLRQAWVVECGSDQRAIPAKPYHSAGRHRALSMATSVHAGIS